mmetsp:Transcript_21610/g.39631  ORF Transcript_21610/g.39631 Transcript_21610/m.39631 type:complete len:195 (-) Transcript_21610:64-648(-)
MMLLKAFLLLLLAFFHGATAVSVPAEDGRNIKRDAASQKGASLQQREAKKGGEIAPKPVEWFKVFDRNWDEWGYRPNDWISRPQNHLRDASWFEHEEEEWDGWHMYGENRVDTNRIWSFWHTAGRHGSGQHDGVHTRPQQWGDDSDRSQGPLLVRWWFDIFPAAEMHGAAPCRSTWIAWATVLAGLLHVHLTIS